MAVPLSSELRGVSSRGIAQDVITDEARALAPANRDAAVNRPQRLTARDQSIVDEAFRRGASVGDAMGVLFVRALSATIEGVPASHALTSGSSRRFTLEERLFSEEPQLSETQQRRLDEVEDVRLQVVARHDAYVALAKQEFAALSHLVQLGFTPQRTGQYIDPYATAEDKYRAMRGAYYRAGWTSICRDVLSLIDPATLFGTAVIGGVHRELGAILTQVEDAVRKAEPGGLKRNEAGFIIGGFNPRFQAGSEQLSNHAFGLAIDVDYEWNPQVKSKTAIQAFQRATGERVDVLFRNVSSVDALRRAYERVVRISRKLQDWLAKFMPMYQQLQADRAKYKGDANAKAKLAALDQELQANPDLAALHTLVVEYSMKTVQAWQAYGIVTIPLRVIELFLSLGKKHGARWGGEYERTKDVMHLELLELASPASLGRRGQAGRRRPVKGLEDLYRA